MFKSTPINVRSFLRYSTITSVTTSQSRLAQFFAHIIRTQWLQNQNSQPQCNHILRAYIRSNAPQKALHAYLHLLHAGFSPDRYTFPIIVKAATLVCSIRACKQFHTDAIRHGLELDEFVESGLITMYAKAGEFEDARNLFETNVERKLGSWNAMLGAYSASGRTKCAIYLFVRMKRGGFIPDEVTMLSIITACGSLGDVNLALQLHKCVMQVKTYVKDDIMMMNSVVDMYGKCGRMDLAALVFSRMANRTVSSWSSMIVGYATHGHVKEAIETFRCMVEEGKLRPNHVTFLGVLSACVHGGLVSEGKHWFEWMRREYGIEPGLKHYGCMVDLLGRAGMLEEARSLIEVMPMKANVVIWGCLLGACEKQNDVKMGEWVTERLLEMEPGNDGVYVALSNIYASKSMWKNVERIRELMKERNLAKFFGYSSMTKGT